MREPIKCADCPAIIKDPWPTQIRCTECAQKRQLELCRANALRSYRKRASVKKEAAAEAKPVKAPVVVFVLAWDLTGKGATQIEIEARALGLSYGKYVAMISSGTIDRHCRDIGIDGLKVIDAAWKAHKKRRAEEEKRRAEKLLHSVQRI